MGHRPWFLSSSSSRLVMIKEEISFSISSSRMSFDFSSTISLILALVLKAGPLLSKFQGFVIPSGLESSMDFCKIVIFLGSGIGGLVVLGIICPFLGFETKSPRLTPSLTRSFGGSSSPFFEGFLRSSAELWAKLQLSPCVQSPLKVS